MNDRDSLSIIIASRNRAGSLNDTLDSLARQEMAQDIHHEILVVDNNSRDNTRELVMSRIPAFRGRLRYLVETREGKSWALNLGIRSAHGTLVAFIDDDVIADNHWLVNIAAFAARHRFDAIGGRILPLYPGKTPHWIKDNKDLLDGPIVLHDYGEENRPYAGTMFAFVGANLVVRRELLLTGDVFRTDLGPGSKALGDDTYLFWKWRKAGKILYYCGKALVWHKVERERMRLGYIARWNIRSGRYYVLTDAKTFLRGDLKYCCGVPRYLIREIIEQSLTVILNIARRRALLKAWIKLFHDIGLLLEARTIKRQCRSQESALS